MTKPRKPKITKKLIDDPYAYGYLLILGDKQAAVVKTNSCSNTWTVFYYHKHHMYCLGFTLPDSSQTKALKQATNYLHTGELPKNPEDPNFKPFTLDTPDPWFKTN